MRSYTNQAVGDLAKQLVGGLLRLRKGYVDSAEALHAIVDPAVEYPYEFVVYRLTGYRPLKGADVPAIPGKALKPDLQRMVLDLCEGFDLTTAGYAEPVYDIEALCEKFRISSKTVQRWRRRGLVARRMTFPDGKRRIGFLKGSVRHFAHNRRRELLRSARFTQMDEAQRERIISLAREMVKGSPCRLHEVSRRLSRLTGRAVETIRYTIRRYDDQNPAQAVFPGASGQIGDQAREVIYRCFLHGVSVTALAEKYQRTRGSVYRIVNEMRYRQMAARQIEFIYNTQFDLPGADDAILQSAALPAPAASAPRAPKDLPPYLQSLYDMPLLSPVQEQCLFMQYNYLKWKADRLRSELDPERIVSGQLRKVERLLMQADAVKNQIIRSNLRLVVSIAKKHVHTGQDLFELISDGNISLMRAVEKFDFARGNRFSTYASWAVMKNFARSVPREKYLLGKFLTGSDEALEVAGTMAKHEPSATALPELRECLDVVLGQLLPRERSIIVHHYGLDKAGEPQTLDQLSHDLGISKERVRQIERRAMDKLRQMLQPDAPGLLG
jgi:RNA polymerase sigma factor (sigma-70 family)